MFHAKRQVNPIIELAGAQWFVREWLELGCGPEEPNTVVLYRLTTDEQRFITQNNLDHALADEIRSILSERIEMPLPADADFDIDAALAAEDAAKAARKDEDK